MSSSDDRFTKASPGVGAWGKKPLTTDIAERIKQQTNDNIQKRLRDQKEDAERRFEEMLAGRKQDRLKHEKEIDDVLVVVDTLLDFIAQRAGELPEELVEMIAQRQEQRILKSAPVDIVSSVPFVAGTDGQILKRTGENGLSWDTFGEADTGRSPSSDEGQDATVKSASVTALHRLQELAVKLRGE